MSIIQFVVNYSIMEKFKAVRGMKDLYGEELRKWKEIEKVCMETAELFGYEEIRTPIVEFSELFERSVGESTDIVEKEMYNFVDKKGRKLALRPEGTASIVRAYLERNLYQERKIARFYYYGPMFRYDRPQKGRYRQFYQFGIEILGGSHPFFDGESVYLLFQILKNLNIKNICFEINSIGCSECKRRFSSLLREYLEKYKNQLCSDCQRRMEKNILRVFDCKQERCREIIKESPKILDTLCDGCKNHFEKFKQYLEFSSIPYKINPHLVRGLDYYTKTVYEVFAEDEKNAIGGGGRYDELVEQLGGPKIPAVGFALGMERVSEIYRISERKKSSIYGIFLGEEAKKEGMKICEKLRKEGFVIKIDYEDRSLKNYLKIADREGEEWCIIMGEDEIKNNKVILKDMKSSQQYTLSYQNIVEEVKRIIKC